MIAAMPPARPFALTEADWQALRKSGAAHKHRYGHAAIVSGPYGHGGAARLAARGALRIGAGLVSVICTKAALAEHASQLTAVMVKPYQDNATSFAECLATVSPQAICVGPNLGLDAASGAVLAQCLTTGIALCVDADAITLLADPSRDLPAISNPQTVMTPHEGELRRFIPDAFAATTCRVTLAQTAADKAGCVVLFKGPDTIIAGPDHAPAVVSSAPFAHASWLATAGSGDVLAGFITGLIARGFDGFRAACIGAELHFRCAEAFGPGLISEDLPEMLPEILR